MKRIVLPELLDVLPPQDESALRSRRDLRRLNACMRHPRLMARILEENPAGPEPRRLVELGAGDGHFLLSVAGRLNGQWRGAEATLVDRLDALDPQTHGDFERLGWRVRSEVADAFDWLRHSPPDKERVVISNLFFHQFDAEQLSGLLRLSADSSRLIVALEPRRSWLSRICGRLLWAIGCNQVTCHDGRVSIHAGFAGKEISALWPDKKNWELTERPISLFSHLFIARRKD
jgi:hypothetical protein